jgi:hypothetical protein
MKVSLHTPINSILEVSPGRGGLSLIVRNESDAPIGFYSMTNAEGLALAQILEEVARGMGASVERT